MNIKNNILAGVCIFIIVLLMPYYWQIIGYEPSTSEEIINSENNKEITNSAPDTPVSTYTEINKNSSNLGQEKTLIVSTNLYQTAISNAGGGSHKDFTILEMDQNGYINLLGDIGHGIQINEKALDKYNVDVEIHVNKNRIF